MALATLPHLSPAVLAETSGSEREQLWYDRPAERWLEALPVGNGFLGGMVYGGIGMERIALSEATAWSGAPGTDEVNPGALPHLGEMRQLFFDGKYDEFQRQCSEFLPGAERISAPIFRCRSCRSRLRMAMTPRDTGDRSIWTLLSPAFDFTTAMRRSRGRFSLRTHRKSL